MKELCRRAAAQKYHSAIENWKKDNKNRKYHTTLLTEKGQINFEIYLNKQTGIIENIYPIK